jgi:hypothetical protein
VRVASANAGRAAAANKSPEIRLTAKTGTKITNGFAGIFLKNFRFLLIYLKNKEKIVNWCIGQVGFGEFPLPPLDLTVGRHYFFLVG